MGFKKGESPVKIGGPVRLVNVRRERLYRMPVEDLALEGFAGLTVQEFITMYCRANNCRRDQMVTRLEWRYL